MRKFPFLLMTFVLLVLTPSRAAAQMSRSDANSWLEKCISKKSRTIQPYSVQSLKLRLNVRVPKNHYLIWKDPFNQRDGDLTIVKHERYITDQCQDELSALHGVPKFGFRYGSLIIYEGPPRGEMNRTELPFASKVSTQSGEAVIYGVRRIYKTTILHPITKKKITLDSWTHPRSTIEETVKHLSFF